jgi:hypothetical protein
MTRIQKRPRDLNQWTPEEQGKDPAAVARGRSGGIKGRKGARRLHESRKAH